MNLDRQQQVSPVGQYDRSQHLKDEELGGGGIIGEENEVGEVSCLVRWDAINPHTN